MGVHVDDHTDEFVEQLNIAIGRALEKVGLVVEGYAKRQCPVDTGHLRDNITHEVENKTVVIGTNVEYAPYVELGTGIYISGGRNTAWSFKDMKGKRRSTVGRMPKPFLLPAVTEHRGTIENIFKRELQNG